MANLTKVVNILKNEPYDVYIGRAGKGFDGYFGNPIPLLGYNRASLIKEYREYFYKRLEEDEEFKSRILSLRGLRLGCFCSPKTCHGDVIAEYLNKLSTEPTFIGIDYGSESHTAYYEIP